MAIFLLAWVGSASSLTCCPEVEVWMNRSVMSHLSLVRDVAPNVWITFWRILHGDAALSHCPKFECFVTQLHGGAGHHEQKKQNRRE